MASAGGAGIENEAIEWLVRREAADDRAAVCAGLDRWLADDPRHRGAFIRAEAAWRLLDRGAALGGQMLAEPDAGMDTIRLSRRGVLAGSAAAVLALAGATAFLASRGRVGPVQHYATRRGEIRRVSLPDGSTALLNTATQIDFALTAATRLVALKSGEGWFRVREDVRRAFIVDGGLAAVSATAAAFVIRRLEERMEVVVSRGHVRLSPDATRSEGLLLDAGRRAIIDTRGGVRLMSLSDEELRRRLAWREGGLGFDGEAVVDAVAAINRSNRLQIDVEPGRLASERVVGWFAVHDPESFAKSIAVTFDARIRIEPDRIVIGDRPKK